MAELAQSEPARPGAAHFDATLNAWILSSYKDVSVALREPLLPAPGIGTYSTAHLSVREEAARQSSAERLTAWRAEIEPLAYRLACRMPAGSPVDLVSAFAAPWSLAAAVSATVPTSSDSQRLASLAREVFLGAACSTDAVLPPQAREAAAELALSFASAGASADVQSFVALSQTLPCFLANAWLELLLHTEKLSWLRQESSLMSQAIEELLRYAGPSRAIFRQAAAPIVIGGANIREGDRVVLLLSAANRDPVQFPDPDCLDFDRGVAGHLAFGAGPHSCAGAPLIRLAASVATRALVSTTESLELCGPVDWIGGFAIRAPASLPVVLRRATA